MVAGQLADRILLGTGPAGSEFDLWLIPSIGGEAVQLTDDFGGEFNPELVPRRTDHCVLLVGGGHDLHNSCFGWESIASPVRSHE